MRARIVRPGFFENESLAATGPAGMLLFQGLWMLADREGRLKDRPVLLKARIFPYFDCEVDALLTELARRGFIIRYEVDGERYIAIVNWHKHQKPHPKDSESIIPPPPENIPKDFPGNPGKVSGEPGNSAEVRGNPRNPFKHIRSLDLNSQDQEPRQDQELKIADQIPALIVNQAITGRPPKANRVVAARLPDPWPLTPEREKYAVEQGVDPLRTHQDFCDYWHAKAGPNARKLDWDATWRTWCRRAAERGHGLARASPDMLLPAVPMSKAEAALAAAYREAAMEEAEKVVEFGNDQN